MHTANTKLLRKDAPLPKNDLGMRTHFMIHPDELLYTQTHEWILFDGNTAKIGVTEYAQDILGDIAAVNLPEPHEDIYVSEAFASIEASNDTADIYSPVTATVLEINESLFSEPEAINESPYDAWLISVGDITEKDDLMDREQYEIYCSECES